MKIKISTRLVFLFRNFVIKIPIDRRGYLQGKNEKKIYFKYKQFNVLCPLIWEKFGIVCQKKCNKIDEIDINTVKKIKKIIPEFNFNNCDLHNFNNWGIYNKRIVLLDYGINKKISKMYK